MPTKHNVTDVMQANDRRLVGGSLTLAPDEILEPAALALLLMLLPTADAPLLTLLAPWLSLAFIRPDLFCTRPKGGGDPIRSIKVSS